MTIATGKDRFFQMAHTLLLSYRLTSSDPLPFAIIADRKNRYTKDFDDVILLRDAKRSYVDKIELLIRAPYAESIFIDADCIAYGNLDRLWESFRDADDFSSIGRVFPLDEPNSQCWFTREGAGKYADQISNLVTLHGGIYFIRQGRKCEEIYRLSHDILAHYRDFTFWMFKKPADEPILALAMTVCGCVPIERKPWHISLYNYNNYEQIDFFHRKLIYRGKNRPDATPNECLLLHFNSNMSDCPTYMLESSKVHFEHRHGRGWNTIEKMLNIAFNRTLITLLRQLHLAYRRIKKKLKK